MATHAPETAFWLSLAYASGLKLARVKAIVAAWCLEGEQPLSSLFELPLERMAAQLGIPAEEGQQLLAAAGRVPAQAAWLARLEGDGIQLITRTDPRYPRALVRWLPPAQQPLLLFCRGDVAILGRPSAAVVGAQDATPEMVGLARELATLLAEEGLVVVSGLGKGVGQAAFGSAFSGEGGQAVGVLPMGIKVFPAVPDALKEAPDALKQGQALLVSPFHPEARFTEAQAIARNRLIAGLTGALFVVAAARQGVARQTADEALRLGKTVYVWDIDPALEPASSGNQALIQAGGLPIAGVADILDAIEAVVATSLELADVAESAPAAPPTPTPEVKETETPYDAQTALDLLSKAGRVPEALARRLRGS